jgi:hypothetical protein
MGRQFPDEIGGMESLERMCLVSKRDGEREKKEYKKKQNNEKTRQWRSQTTFYWKVVPGGGRLPF